MRYSHPAGYLPLRHAIAAHLATARGVRCTAEQGIIVTGSQQALDLCARLLLDPGDRAWIEDPGYLGARAALVAAGAELVPVPVDDEGLDVAAGKASSPDARLAVVTPSHQFPLGVTMSLPRRLALIDWAHSTGSWVVEDDYDAEFRYVGRPLTALQGIGGLPSATADAESWPDMGRVVREDFRLEFSNTLAKQLLDWKPAFDFATGASLTRTWLEFVGMVQPTL